MQKVILSRLHPLKDGFPDKVKVIEKNHDNIVLDPRWNPPSDWAEDVWRIDEASSEELVQRMVDNLHEFVTSGNTMFRKLICTPLHGEERISVNRMNVLPENHVKLIDDCCRMAQLNWDSAMPYGKPSIIG